MRSQAHSSHNRVVGIAILVGVDALAGQILIDQAMIWCTVWRGMKDAVLRLDRYRQ